MSPPRVALFATCLCDLFRPSVCFAAAELLERAGARADVPLAQTCCGQPAWNSGDRATAIRMAERMIPVFEPYDYVVAPSGSCTAMLRIHYPRLLEGRAELAERAGRLARRTFELTSFLVDVLGFEDPPGRYRGRVTFHDSCSGLRELGIRDQPRRLLAALPGVELVEMEEPDRCCGFGGTFCVKYPEISTRMAQDKAAMIEATGAGTVVAGDLGCLMNLAGLLRRQGSSVEVRHVAELLADRLDAPPIGGGRRP